MKQELDRTGVVDGLAAGGAAPPVERSAERTSYHVAAVAFGALLARDLRVLTRERWRFLIRTLSQPLMLSFVFTYVLPTIGQGFQGPGGSGSFASILVPGVLAIAVLFKGIQSVALPLVQEFGYTREIEDRVMAPLPIWAVAVGKIVAGAGQGLLGAALVFPILLVVPAQPAELAVSWPALVGVLLLAPFLSAAMGLALGTTVEPDQVSLMFSVVILPVTFLGAVYFPWSSLAAIPWLQWLTLLNPLVYISEGFRIALTPQFPHMPAVAVFGAMLGLTLVVGGIGVRGFYHRVQS